MVGTEEKEMTGSHHVRFVRKNRVVKSRNVEAIELSPQFSGRNMEHSAQNEIYDWLALAKKRDKIVIETELEE